jgi:hypothetical protein
MTLRLNDTGAGGAAALSSPWVQAALAAQTLNRNGSGLFIASAVSAADVNAYRNDTTFGDEQWSRVVIGANLSSANNYVAVHINCQGTGAGYKSYSLYTDSTTGVTHTGLYKANGSGGTDLIGIATTFAATDVMAIRRVGNTLYAYKNGVLLISFTDDGVTNGAVYTGGAPGFGLTFNTGSSPQASDWQGGDSPIIPLSVSSAHTTDNTLPAASTTVTSTRTVNIGDTVVVVVGGSYSGAGAQWTGCTVSDSAGNTYVRQAQQLSAAGKSKQEIWTCLSAALAATSVQAAMTGVSQGTAGSIGIDVSTYVGVLGIGTGPQIFTGAGTAPSGTLTTAHADNTVIGLLTIDYDGPDSASNNNWATAPTAGFNRDLVHMINTLDSNIAIFDQHSATATSVAITTGTIAASVDYVLALVELSSVAVSIVRVGQAGNSTAIAAATTIAQNLGVAVQVGDVIIADISWAATGATLPTSVVDNLGNTYTNPTNALQQDSGNNQSFASYYSIATSAGTPTVTATWAASQSYRALMVTAYRRTGGLVFDKAVSALVTANPSSSGSIVVAANDSLLHGTADNMAAFGPPIPTTGFSAGLSVGDGSTTVAATTEWTTAAAGTTAVTFDNPGTPTNVVIALAFSPTGVTSAALTGTALSSITEADIVAGGKTIIITLTGDTWITV